MADNFTTFTCRLSWNLVTSTSWNPHGLSRPVMGLLYLYLYLTSLSNNVFNIGNPNLHRCVIFLERSGNYMYHFLQQQQLLILFTRCSYGQCVSHNKQRPFPNLISLTSNWRTACWLWSTKCFFFSRGAAAERRLWLPPSRGFLITHNYAPQSVGLLWTCDQLVAETSTWQHITLTTNIHAPGGIRTQDSSRRAAVDLLLYHAATGNCSYVCYFRAFQDSDIQIHTQTLLLSSRNPLNCFAKAPNKKMSNITQHIDILNRYRTIYLVEQENVKYNATYRYS
jgi:hypothetical protein